MSEDIESRRARVAAALEKQIEKCGRLAGTILDKASDEYVDYYNLPIAVALLRISGQLGTAIARRKRRRNKAAGKNSKTAVQFRNKIACLTNAALRSETKNDSSMADTLP